MARCSKLRRWRCCRVDDSYHIVTIDRQRDVVIERSNNFVAWIESRLARDEDNVRVLPTSA
jgi:hypothetical protein